MPKKGSILSPVNIVGMNEKAEAWGHSTDGKEICFDQRRTAPGEQIEASVLGKRQGRLQGRVEKILSAAPSRREPECNHFGVCGGCSLQHISYPAQLALKDSLVRTLLSRTMEADGAVMLQPIPAPSEFHFRNKMEYTASARPWLRPEDMSMDAASLPIQRRGSLGLFVPFSSNKVIDVSICHVQHPIGDLIRNWTRDYAARKNLTYYNSTTKQGFLRTILVRNTRDGQSLAMFVVGEDREDLAHDLCKDFTVEMPQVSSVWYLVNTKMNDSYTDLEPVHFSGSKTIEEVLDGLRFSIGPQTFFQVNSAQTEVMYKRIMELGNIGSQDTVWDLYCGVGTISSYAARLCNKVIGIEYVEAAVSYARETCKQNGITNAFFFAGDMKDLLTDSFTNEHGRPDLVITDPPRAGMHPAACEVLARSGAARIVYVSCKPESLARDLAILSRTYKPVTIQTVDLMPQSSHIETLAYLELRK